MALISRRMGGTRASDVRSAGAAKVSARVLVPGGTGLGIIPVILVLLAVIVLPVIAVVRHSFEPNPLLPDGAPHAALDNYARLVEQPAYRAVLWRTLSLTLIATALSVMLGVAISVALTLYRRRVSSVALAVVIAPLLTGPIVAVVGWVALMSEDGAVYWMVNAVRNALGLPTTRVLGTEPAIVVGLVHFTLPFVVLTLVPLLRRMPADLIEASLALGEGPARTAWRVVLPLLRPGLVAATVMALAVELGAFVNPQFLGGDRNAVLVTFIAQLMNTFDPTLAAAACVLLLTVGLVLVAFYSRAVRSLSR